MKRPSNSAPISLVSIVEGEDTIQCDKKIWICMSGRGIERIEI